MFDKGGGRRKSEDGNRGAPRPGKKEINWGITSDKREMGKGKKTLIRWEEG